MVVNFPVSDLLIRIKNGYLAKNAQVLVPWSKLKESIAALLTVNGYLESCDVTVDGAKKTLVLKLKYDHKQPAVTDVKIVSKPSLRVYAGKNGLPKVLGGLGLAIISTPAGLMSAKDARAKGLGGEVVCEVW